MSDPAKPQPASRKERDYARHHQDILDVAESLFAEKGYYQATMQMIADRAEFSVGYLYKHFSGKEEMYQEMVHFHLTTIDALMQKVAALGLGPLDEIHRTYQEFCSHFNRHRDFMRIFHEEIGGDFCDLAEGKKKHFQDLKIKLTRAQELGELKPYDPTLLTAAIQGATKELFAELAERPGDNPFDSLPDVLFKLLIDPLRN